jgi:hypothetical protein
MATLMIAFLLLAAASIATIRWLAKAPLGYEDEAGFHPSPERRPIEERKQFPVSPTIRPPLMPRELSHIP